jgi:GntR family transcriptional regulator
LSYETYNQYHRWTFPIESSFMSQSSLVVPKYHQIYVVLRERILEGQFADGFPGEHVLAQTYAVSRVTLRRALEQLSAEGLISRERGRGTTVTPPRPQKESKAVAADKTDISGLLENIVSLGLRTTVRVIDVAVIGASPEVARDLQLAPNAPVQKAVRVRSHRGAPMSFITTYIPQQLAQDFGKRELEKSPVLSLLQRAGVKIGNVQQFLGAELADARTAECLDVQVGSALLAVRRIVLDANGRPVQLLRGLYRPDRYEYRMQLSASGETKAEVWTAD